MSPERKRRVLIFVEHAYEDLELWYPKIRLIEEGMEVVVAGPEKIVYPGKNGYPCRADQTFDEVKADDFDALVIPGGWAPDKLRRDPRVLDLVRAFDRASKPIAMICHAGWVPISAKIVKGKRLTSVGAIRDDLENAGGIWVDEPVVVDGRMVTAQVPKDLPAMMQAILQIAG